MEKRGLSPFLFKKKRPLAIIVYLYLPINDAGRKI
jgi:hypothetical protein